MDATFHLEPVDRQRSERMRERLDRLAKPPGSLGRLEALACQIAAIQERFPPNVVQARTIVFAASHGVNRVHQVSAYPDSVTASMVETFVRGGAAINVLARQGGVDVEVVDAGVDGLEIEPGIGASAMLVRTPLSGRPNADIVAGPAVSEDKVDVAIGIGRAAADRAIDAGADVLCLGEMGIGNTTPSSAVAMRLLDKSAEELVGPGAGLDAEGIEHKRAVIQKALARGDSHPGAPLECLADIGGADFLAMASAALRAAERHTPVVVDGFIVSAAVLAAARAYPHLKDYLIPATLSEEPGHRALLDALGAGEPLIDMSLRLGEGSAATFVVPLLRSACALPNEMSSLEDVLDRGGDHGAD